MLAETELENDCPLPPMHYDVRERLRRKVKPCLCAECGADLTVTGYRWSPYFCPPCDGERLERVTKQLKTIVVDFAERHGLDGFEKKGAAG